MVLSEKSAPEVPDNLGKVSAVILFSPPVESEATEHLAPRGEDKLCEKPALEVHGNLGEVPAVFPGQH